jgi:hypothetical protein
VWRSRDPLTVCFNPFDRRKEEKWLSLVVECSILVELVVHRGIAHFLVVHGGKGNYPFFFSFIQFTPFLAIFWKRFHALIWKQNNAKIYLIVLHKRNIILSKHQRDIKHWIWCDDLFDYVKRLMKDFFFYFVFIKKYFV